MSKDNSRLALLPTVSTSNEAQSFVSCVLIEATLKWCLPLTAMIAARRNEITRCLSNHRERAMLYILHDRHDRRGIASSESTRTRFVLNPSRRAGHSVRDVSIEQKKA